MPFVSTDPVSVEPRLWAWLEDSRQSRLPPTRDRWRAVSYSEPFVLAVQSASHRHGVGGDESLSTRFMHGHLQIALRFIVLEQPHASGPQRDRQVHSLAVIFRELPASVVQLASSP